jgi:hypothetical protein
MGLWRSTRWVGETGPGDFFGFLCGFLVLVSGIMLVTGQETNFTYTSFAAGSVTLVGDARIVDGRIWVCNVSDTAYENQLNSDGRALYPHPVQVRDPATKAVASFRTSFQFSIDTDQGQYSDTQPSGLAWGLFPDNTSIGDTGLYLGVMNQSNDNFLTNHVFAVEVDTGYSNFGAYQDISSCHLGLDLLTMNSKPVFDMAAPLGSNASLCVQDRGVHTLTVAYNNPTHVKHRPLRVHGGLFLRRLADQPLAKRNSKHGKAHLSNVHEQNQGNGRDGRDRNQQWLKVPLQELRVAAANESQKQT